MGLLLRGGRVLDPGAGTLPGMREYALRGLRVRALAFLNISAIGLAWLPVGELNLLAYADVDAAVGAAREHRRRGLVAALTPFPRRR